MLSEFSGRKPHLKDLEGLYHDHKADLVLVYGRRRVGKSRLIGEFLKGKKNVFYFIGLEPFADHEGESQRSRAQIQSFLSSLSQQVKRPLFKQLNLSTWEECLTLLTGELPAKNVPCCIFFDELPWMACQRLELIRALFKFWEMSWSRRSKFMLIVCGSSVGFLEKHFIKSSLFYGRATHHIHLHPWTLAETKAFFGNTRQPSEVLNLYMHFGGIPRYLEQVSVRDSVRKAISRLCFLPDSFFITEIETLFRSSFIRLSPKYHQVVQALTKNKSLNYQMLAKKTKSALGSSFKYIIDNLLNADLIAKTVPFDKITNTNFVDYSLSDEFLCFYLQYIQPHIDLIRSSSGNTDLYDLILPERKLFSWLGRTFEKIMVKHATEIAKVLGLEKVVIHHGSFFGHRGEECCQIDLVFLRTDKTITACEIKYSEGQIGLTKDLVSQIQKQKDWLKMRYPGKRVETILVTNTGVSADVLRSDLVQHVVTAAELM